MAETIYIQTAPSKITYSVAVISPQSYLVVVPKLDRAFMAVVAVFAIDAERLKTNHSRQRDLVMGRQAVWLIVREDDLHVTLKSMGAYFGKFDHTTVMHGVQSLRNAMITDKALERKFKKAVELYNISGTHIEQLQNPDEYAD